MDNNEAFEQWYENNKDKLENLFKSIKDDAPK